MNEVRSYRDRGNTQGERGKTVWAGETAKTNLETPQKAAGPSDNSVIAYFGRAHPLAGAKRGETGQQTMALISATASSMATVW